jgi:hypothetical protein
MTSVSKSDARTMVQGSIQSSIEAAEALRRKRSDAGYKAHATLMARKLHEKRSNAAKKAWATIRSRQVG